MNKEKDNLQKCVSVIVPCFNQGNYLAETLESVFRQTYSDWECVIVNDGSTDCTEEVAQSFCKRDSRFRYFYKSNTGLADTRNYAIDRSEGTYILPLDSDDLLSENFISEAVSVFETKPETTLVYPVVKLFGTKNKKWFLPEYSYDTILYQNVIVCSAMYKKADYLKTKGYNPNMKYGLEDWDFWLSLLNPQSSVVRLNNIRLFYRIKKTSMTTALHRENNIDEMFRQIFLNHQDIYQGRFDNPLKTCIDAQMLEKYKGKSKKYKKLFIIMSVATAILALALTILLIMSP